MLQKPLVLGVETSCDESALSLLDIQTGTFVAELTRTQAHHHAPYGGVVPNLASQLHLDLLAKMLQTLDAEVPGWQAKVGLVGATTRPGLITSLLVGAVFGRSMAAFLDVPFVSVDHCEAHLYSSLLPESGPVELEPQERQYELPACALVISGGHSFLIYLDEQLSATCVGATLDDAMGECFDKVAKMMDFGYPGGPEIERRAGQGTRGRFKLPVPMPQGLDFSFSGLKTAVRLAISKEAHMHDPVIQNGLCADFHHAIESLVTRKLETCIRHHNPRSIWLSGGVSANGRIRGLVERICKEKQLVYRIVPRKYAGDNASMIAYLAFLKYKREPDYIFSEEIVPYSIFTGETI